MRSLVITSVLLAACGGGTVDGMLMMEPPPPPPPPPVMPPPEVTVVPLEVELLSTTSTCVPLNGTRVLGVGPEGHLWLGTSSVSTSVRVLDGWGAAALTFDLAVSQIQAAQIWTATTASLIADDTLFSIRDAERYEISSPIEIGDADLCGDLASRAFVLAGGRLIERAGDEWIEWTGLGEILDAAAFVGRDGACWGGDDQVWLTSGPELWRMGPASITQSDMAGEQVALIGDRVLALRSGHLFAPGKKWAFAAGDPRLLSAGGSYAWIAANDQLLRFDGETFARAAFDGEIRALYPHASGGIWIETPSEACHLAPQAMVRIEGIASGEQRSDEVLRFKARSSVEVTAQLDGEAIAPVATDGPWSVFEAELALGWRTISLSAGGTERALAVKRLPSVQRSFEADIRPIYEANCTGSVCHVPENTSGPPDFSRYEVWIMKAEQVRARIVERQDMPPLASRTADWGEDEITIIAEWLSGGLRP